MVKSVAKEAITESSIVDGGAIVIEDVKYASTDEQAVLRNTQRTIEDMLDIAPQSRVREGLTLTNTTTTLELATGRGLVNGRWIRTAAQTDFAPADLLSGAGMASVGTRFVGIWIEEETDNFAAAGNDRDVDNELLYLWEDADTVDIPDNVLLIAHITRDGADEVTSITNFHTTNYPEIRGNDIMPLANNPIRVKDYRGIVLATLSSGSVVFGDGGTETVDMTFPNDVDIINDLTVTNDLHIGEDAYVATSLTVSGTTLLVGNVDIRGVVSDGGGNFTITDNVDLTGTLAVTGDATVSTTLDVTGATTVDDLIVGGSGTVAETLDVTGDVTANSFNLDTVFEEIRSIEPFAFIPYNSSTTYVVNGGTVGGKLQNTSGGNANFFYHLNLPNGAILTDVKVFGSDGTNVVYVAEITHADGSNDVLDTGSVNTEASDINETIDNETHSYKITVVLGDDDMIYGAYYRYTDTVIKP